jgi:PKD repeat protein
VTLTVTDNVGATDTKGHAVSAVNAAPLASFTATCSGLTCSVDASGSTDSDGTIASYAWAFGDGATGSGATMSHAYAAAGTYSVTLIVTDNDGAAGAQSQNLVTTQAHVGDLDGAGTTQGGSWTAIVTIIVHDSSHVALAHSIVSGSWTAGGAASCTTNENGQCTVSRSSVSNGTKLVTFTVSGVTHAVLTYKPADNHDPDGDSNGTSITVSRR